MNKLLMFMMSFVMLFTLSCSGDDPVSPNDDSDEPVLVGCEATTFYDWNDFEFSSSLDAGATTWLGFELEETTLFSIDLNQAGFHCAIFTECDGELGAPPPLYTFMTNGNGQEVGIVTEGTYYLEITNTRPGRLDFDFSISLADIVYGCMDDDAINYDETANEWSTDGITVYDVSITSLNFITDHFSTFAVVQLIDPFLPTINNIAIDGSTIASNKYYSSNPTITTTMSADIP